MATTITQQANDFTDKDFDSWVIELRTRVNSAFPGWTDFNTPNFGNILLEMFAHTLDVMSFYQDQQYLETRIVFAQLRRSMIALGKNVGFELPGATVATADLEFTIADGLPRAVDILIPAGTVIRTNDSEENVEFDLLAQATILAGTTLLAGQSAENARVQSDAITTDGTADQRLPLLQTPYVDNSASIVIGVDTYTQAPNNNFLSSGPTDQVFRIDVDENDRATVVFGDGINGVIPNGAGTTTYKTGGGESGNVDANTINTFRDGPRFAALDGEEVQILVRNPSAAGGGVERMSVEEARVAIPASLRTVGNRSVTRDDFEDNAKKVRGVARAMMLTSDDDASIPENTGELYIVPVGGGLPSVALKTEVADFIASDYPPTITFTFTVEDPILLITSFDAIVHLNPGVTELEARTATEASLDAFFSLLLENGAENEQIDFGFKIRTERMPVGTVTAEIPFSDLFNAIRDSELPDGRLAYRKVEEDTFVPANDVAILDKEFPILGSISLTNGETLTPF